MVKSFNQDRKCRSSENELLHRLLDELETEAIGGNAGNDEQRCKAVSKQKPCQDTAQIGTLIGSPQLNDTVHDQRNHEQNTEADGRTVKEPDRDRGQHADQLAGASGADGEFLSLPMEGPVISAMAAKDNRQPFITPLLQGLHCTGDNTDDDHQKIVDNGDDHGDQCALAGSLGGLGLGVLPDQEQDQTNDGNTAAQSAPPETTIVNDSGLGILSNTAVGADNSLIVDLSTTVLAKSHNNSS